MASAPDVAVFRAVGHRVDEVLVVLDHRFGERPAHGGERPLEMFRRQAGVFSTMFRLVSARISSVQCTWKQPASAGEVEQRVPQPDGIQDAGVEDDRDGHRSDPTDDAGRSGGSVAQPESR